MAMIKLAGGNTHELYKTFTEVHQQDEVRENNAAGHASLCVLDKMLKNCRIFTLQLCRDM